MNKDRLAERIKILPMADQVVLSLFYVDELDFNQIAKALDCTVMEAVEKLSGARARLDWME